MNDSQIIINLAYHLAVYAVDLESKRRWNTSAILCYH